MASMLKYVLLWVKLLITIDWFDVDCASNRLNPEWAMNPAGFLKDGASSESPFSDSGGVQA